MNLESVNSENNSDLDAQLRDAHSQIAELQRAVEELEDAKKCMADRLTSFAYVVSHDLRSSLRTITSFVQLLQRKPQTDPEAAEFMQVIVQSTAELNQLIKDLQEFYEVTDVARLKPAPTSLDVPVQFALLKLANEIKESGAVIKFDSLPTLDGDLAQLTALFAHLLSNAIKFRGEGPPEITITAVEDDQSVTVTVRDNGIGIPSEFTHPKKHEAVFGVFRRLHGKEVPGTGIGLALCDQIVRNHGGRIWIEPDQRQGAAFSFTLAR